MKLLDEINICVKSGFLKKILSKIIAKRLKANCGYDVAVGINDLSVQTNDDYIHFDLNVHMSMDKKDFMEMLNRIG